MAERSRGSRLYRAFLRLFPGEFRGDFGDEMTADFDEQRREAGSRPAVRRLWLRTALDLLWRAPREHLDVLRRDAGYAVRVLRRHPVSTAAAVVSLAIGIGLNSAVFSVVYGVLWRELPFPDSERLVLVSLVRPSEPVPSTFMNADLYEALRGRSRQLAGLGAAEMQPLTVTAPSEPANLGCAGVSRDFFAVLGVRPLLGREFTHDDYAQSRADWARAESRPAPRVAMLSHMVWQQRFGGDRAVVGREMTLAGGDRVEIVGVMSPDLESLSPLTVTGCWLPKEPDPEALMRGSMLAVGRIAPAATLDTLQAELDVMGPSIVQSAAQSWAARGETPVLRATALRDRMVRAVRPQLLLLIGAVVCVLLVTCANVANLFLARAAGRRDELSTRVALGATRARLTRELLTEALTVAAAGGAAGFVLALAAMPVLVATAPRAVPRLDTIEMDWATVALTAVVTVAVGTACGLLAALYAHRRMALGIRTAPARITKRTSRVRQSLAVAEVALALVLVVAATLMVRTMQNLAAVDLGFDPSGVLAVSLPSPPGTRADPIARAHAAMVEQVRELPGVVAAGVGIGPLSGGGMFQGGVTALGDVREFDMRVDAVSPGYFEALGVRLLAGRFFEPRDTEGGAEPMILINDRAARTFWPNQQAVGKVLAANRTQELRVVGVIADLREASLAGEPDLTMYQLSTQSRSFGASSMLVRVEGDAAALVPAMQAMLRAVNREEPQARVTTLQERIDRETAPRRFVLKTVGLFSVIGLLLAVLGVYALVAEFVAQRVPEIGVRMTLGARAPDVARLILRQGWRLVRVGIPLGLLGAVLLRGTMSTMVYGVDTLDPLTYAAAALALFAAAALACAIPAARAVRLDPVTALRTE